MQIFIQQGTIVAAESISHFIFMAFYVYNFAIKTIEEISPSDMVASSVIFLLRISEHFVVSDHCEIMASYELIEPLHEGFQHAKSFQLVGKISTLC